MILRATAALLGLLLLIPPASAATYYVDCAGGNDLGDGLSQANAWRTLATVNNNRKFVPGDTILFRRGTTCSGMLWPKGSGAAQSPITAGAWGEGAAPVIDGGNSASALRLFNQQGWHIENLEFTRGSPCGIEIGGNQGLMTHFRITNVAVHDVGGELSSKESGLVVIHPDWRSPGYFADVVIDGVTAWNTTQWGGIVVVGASYTPDMNGAHGNGVTVRNSVAHDVYGDGIVLFVVQNGLIEKSVAWRTGQQPRQTVGTPSAIWTWMCNDCVSQFNESWLSSSPDVDGGAFDIDWGTRDNVMQFNYGHHAKGYCASVFGAENLVTSNAEVRYNVCVNNARDAGMAIRQGDIFLSTWDGGTLDGVAMHDNAIYWSPAADAPILNNSAEFKGASLNRFEHNAVVSRVPSLVLTNTALSLDRNRYWVMGGTAGTFVYGSQSYPDFASYRRGSGQDRYGSFGPAAVAVPPYHGESLDPASTAGAQGAPQLIAVLDGSDASHSQTVVLRSMQEQYAARGLKVRIFGSPAPEWRLDGISVTASIPPALAAGARPAVVLAAANGKIVRRWAGYAPAQAIGPRIEQVLGTWEFGEYTMPGEAAIERMLCPERGCGGAARAK